MKLLLIVGSADDIFIFNYAKWLKSSMDVKIDVFEFFPAYQQGYDNSLYNEVGTAKGCGISKLHVFVDPHLKSYALKCFLKGKYYDIIHCHWIVSPIVLRNDLHDYCDKLVITFWGGEFDNQRIFYSKRLYRYYLNRFSQIVDCIVNSKNGISVFTNQLPYFKGVCKYASFGSAPLEAMYDLMTRESKNDSKAITGMPRDKYVVLIGYSGKLLHNHIRIIKELQKYPALKEKIHLLAPMTRGGSDNYISKVREELENSGFSYSLLCGVFLTDEEIGRIRNATDIVLQLSEFDGFSRSIIECLCAKSVMIYGNWLGYERYMPEAGFKGIPVDSLETGIGQLESIVNNMQDYSSMIESNYESGKNQGIWSNCIKDWVTAYDELKEA